MFNAKTIIVTAMLIGTAYGAVQVLSAVLTLGARLSGAAL